ncbi:LysM-like peptidoglycan-binding domain-containing protein [Oceanimonas pelagia]|uniref:LysM-like peptidoglycan-binding domain-containing protein n=1 Tax=Oceanimonas pelagia TaxID=3028314 RepID=A0AA50KML4_9GAMM|nr:LysM-like peptidoglycan-binding domain-containing protein [Oceanimonas pelagia]WMC09873.1 LysM-like peptidoglycan-binding domain-containing protein [Oceanimonas pelagia]
MTRRKSAARGHQGVSLGTRINQLTLPARRGLGQALSTLGRLPRLHRLGLLVLVPLWLLLLGWQPAPPAPQTPVTGSLTVPLSDADKRVIDVPAGGRRIDHTLAPGETLSSLFRNWQLPGQELIALVRAEPSYKPLSRLQAGQQLTLVLNADGRLHYLEIRDNGLVLNAFRRLGQEFTMVNTQ